MKKFPLKSLCVILSLVVTPFLFAQTLIVVSHPYLQELVQESSCHTSSIQVKSLIPYGADPHTYSPSFSTAKTLELANFVFGIGLNFDNQLLRSSHLIQGKNLFFLEKNLLNQDIHIWQSYEKTLDFIDKITAVLLTNGLIQNNHCAETYKNSLFQAKQKIQKHLNTVPVCKRILIVPHNAFSYFTTTYGWINWPVSTSFNDEDAVSWKSIQAVTQFLTQHRSIKTIFSEYGTSVATMKRIADFTHTHVAGPLYGDNLTSNPTAHTIISLWTKNAETIVQGIE